MQWTPQTPQETEMVISLTAQIFPVLVMQLLVQVSKT
jgi:hypothetical protein